MQAVSRKIHYWFLDERFVNILKESEVDYFIWYSPYKHYIGLKEDLLPKVCVYDVKRIDNNILRRYNESKMESVEI